MPYYPGNKPDPSGEKQRKTAAAVKRNRLLRLSAGVLSLFSVIAQP